MMNKTQLYIKLNDTWTELDLSDNTPFPIIFNITDVRDISKKNSSYSKTLTLPHTDNNSNVLNFIFDIANESSFNANKKVRAYVLNDTIQVFEGFFQLVRIKTDDNIKFTYDCVIFGESDTLINNIGESFLTDLDLTEIDHSYTKANIEASWLSDCNTGYYYPLIDYNNRWTTQKLKLGVSQSGTLKGPEVRDFKPAVYVKYIWDKIFKDAGFTYDSRFLNSETFKNLIIPFSGSSLKRSPQWDYENTFLAQVLNEQPIYVTGSNPTLSGQLGELLMTSDSGINKGVAGTSSRIKFNNDFISPAGDPSNLWSTTLFQYTNNNTPKNQRIVIDLDFTIANFGYVDTFPDIDINTTFKDFCFVGIRVKRSINPYTLMNEPNGFCIQLENLIPDVTTTSTLSPQDKNKYTYRMTGGYLNSTNNNQVNSFYDSQNLISSTTGLGGERRYKGRLGTLVLDGTTPNVVNLFPGERLWVEVFYSFWSGVSNQVTNLIKSYQTTYNKPVVKINTLDTQIFNSPEPEVLVDQPISMKDSMPLKIKKKDFVISIIKMFNLFIEPSKNNVNNLLIEPRDEYYSLGKIVDWSDKLDISKPIEQDIIAEAQNKKLLFTYKEDKDKLNIDYKTEWNQIYGQFEYQVDNDFITGEKKIDVIFSPTPIVDVGWLTNEITRFAIPVIVPNDASSEVKNYGGIKILQRGTQSVDLQGDFWRFDGDIKYSYPYAGHFNHPFNPTTDINWGQTEVLYYYYAGITNNNLFNNYYRKMIDELTDKDSRIITAYFYLSPQDIYKLRFYDSIFVQSLSSSTGNYFKINKIEYDPIKKGSYKVELLKVNDIEIEIKRSIKPTTTKPVITKPGKTTIDIDRVTIGRSNTNNGIGLISGDNNYVTTGTKADIFGSNNVVRNNVNLGTVSNPYNNVAILGGNNNTINSEVTSSVIIASDNSEIGLSTKNVVIVGGIGNKITDNVENSVVIGGYNMTVRQSNVVKMGGIFMSGTNYIGAGRGDVLNRFPDDKVINFISAGRGVVRELGTNSKENIISGGYGFIV